MPNTQPAATPETDAAAAQSLTLKEILAQPEAWARAFRLTAEAAPEIRRLLAGVPAIFCGCGTSRYLAIAAARVHQEVTGQVAHPVAASEVFLAPESVLTPGHRGALVAFSRSGETTETVMAARYYREHGYGPVVGVTAEAGSSLVGAVDLPLVFPWASDQSVVMTRSFTTMLLGGWTAAAVAAGDKAYLAELERLPALASQAIETSRPFAARLGQDDRLRQFVFLGMGGYLGLAYEGMLKLKEMTQVPTEAYSPLEFRHGPISIVDSATAVVLLATERGSRYFPDLLAHAKKCGARTVAVGYPVEGLGADEVLPLGGPGAAGPGATGAAGPGPALTDRSRGLLCMPFLQLLAFERALALGRDPDRPQHLSRVVHLDG